MISIRGPSCSDDSSSLPEEVKALRGRPPGNDGRRAIAAAVTIAIEGRVFHDRKVKFVVVVVVVVVMGMVLLLLLLPMMMPIVFRIGAWLLVGRDYAGEGLVRDVAVALHQVSQGLAYLEALVMIAAVRASSPTTMNFDGG